MILSFINIRKGPREMLKTSGFALGFQHLPRDLANVNEWKIMFDPYNEPPHDKPDKMTCTPSDDSDEPGHPSRLIRAFAVRTKEQPIERLAKTLIRQADVQADLSHRWAQSDCWFCPGAAKIILFECMFNV